MVVIRPISQPVQFQRNLLEYPDHWPAQEKQVRQGNFCLAISLDVVVVDVVAASVKVLKYKVVYGHRTFSLKR